MSQGLLPSEKDIAHKEALDEVCTCMWGGVGKADWPMGTSKKKVGETDLSEEKVGEPTEEIALKEGLSMQEKLSEWKKSSCVTLRAKGHLPAMWEAHGYSSCAVMLPIFISFFPFFPSTRVKWLWFRVLFW